MLCIIARRLIEFGVDLLLNNSASELIKKVLLKIYLKRE